jgi:DNA-binding transcriptional ArsR family regulator
VSTIDKFLRSSGKSSHIRVLYETGIEHERRESASQVIAMLDDIADAIWTLSDEKMPPEKKQRARAAVRELHSPYDELNTTANERKERSDGPANRRGGAEAARAAGRRMDP